MLTRQRSMAWGPDSENLKQSKFAVPNHALCCPCCRSATRMSHDFASVVSQCGQTLDSIRQCCRI